MQGIKCVYVFLVSLNLFACAATGVRYTDIPPVQGEGKAQVVIFRESNFSGGGACYQTFLDDKSLGFLANGGFLRETINAGEHKVSLLEDKAIFNLDAISGGRYFLEVKTQYTLLSEKQLCKPTTSFGNTGFIFCLLEVKEQEALQKLKALNDSSEKFNCLNKQ